MKRKLDEVTKKLELLYDRLRENSVSMKSDKMFGSVDYVYGISCNNVSD